MSLLKAGEGLSCVLKVNSASQRLTPFFSFFFGGVGVGGGGTFTSACLNV